MDGPILKDATYFGFWGLALLVFVVSQAIQLWLLWGILRVLRG